jgi:hypothetical protein
MYKQRGKNIVFTTGEAIYLDSTDDTKDEHRIAQEIKEKLYHIPNAHGTNH